MAFNKGSFRPPGQKAEQEVEAVPDRFRVPAGPPRRSGLHVPSVAADPVPESTATPALRPSPSPSSPARKPFSPPSKAPAMPSTRGIQAFPAADPKALPRPLSDDDIYFVISGFAVVEKDGSPLRHRLPAAGHTMPDGGTAWLREGMLVNGSEGGKAIVGGLADTVLGDNAATKRILDDFPAFAGCRVDTTVFDDGSLRRVQAVGTEHTMAVVFAMDRSGRYVVEGGRPPSECLSSAKAAPAEPPKSFDAAEIGKRVGAALRPPPTPGRGFGGFRR